MTRFGASGKISRAPGCKPTADLVEPTMRDSNLLKQNEYSFQNRKYAKTPLEIQKHITSKASFEQRFLTPKHKGGHERGHLFTRAIDEIVSENLSGKRILDYCCGRGDLAVYLCMENPSADIYGFDFSDAAIKIARLKSQVNKLNGHFDVMDAENLNYADGFFDYIIGFEALHHVVIHPNVPKEIARVVKKNGKIVFAENYGQNPIFELYRTVNTLRKNKSSERGEIILKRSIINEKFSPYFSKIDIFPLSFLYMMKHRINSRVILEKLFALDNFLLGKVSILNELCGESVIVLQNKI
jgi:2-polyprenyl-3-methyl-5-hydroxy-6-metoxy-1,4-benzoquinol methylase